MQSSVRCFRASSTTTVKIMTISVNKKNIEDARNYFARVGADLIAHFGRLGSKCVELETDERLRIFHEDVYKRQFDCCFVAMSREKNRTRDFTTLCGRCLLYTSYDGVVRQK